MTKKKAALYALLVAMLGGVLTALGAKYIFPEWATRNEMLMLIIMGAILGPTYAILVNWGQRKK